MENGKSSSCLRDGMMNRIGWFTYLRLIFENVPHVTKNTLWRTDFLNEIVAFQDVVFLL